MKTKKRRMNITSDEIKQSTTSVCNATSIKACPIYGWVSNVFEDCTDCKRSDCKYTEKRA